MNLFLLLHALGLGHELHGEHLLPIGTVYDPFVCRGLDALIYGLYSGARFVVVGTPAGITLAPEGGAHQSTITPSIGLELPGLTYAEPAFADGARLAAVRRAGPARRRPTATSLYLRLSTRPIDQAPFAAAARAARRGAAARRRARRRLPAARAGRRPAAVVLATCGPVVPEVLAAADALDAEGRAGARARPHQPRPAVPRLAPGAARRRPATARPPADDHHLARLLGAGRAAAADRHRPRRRQPPPGLARRRVRRAASCPVGVDEFGQSGTIPELYGAVRPAARADRQRRPGRHRLTIRSECGARSECGMCGFRPPHARSALHTRMASGRTTRGRASRRRRAGPRGRPPT